MALVVKAAQARQTVARDVKAILELTSKADGSLRNCVDRSSGPRWSRQTKEAVQWQPLCVDEHTVDCSALNTIYIYDDICTVHK